MAEMASNPIPHIKEGRKLYQYLATLVAGLAAFQVGMIIGWTSPVLPYLMSEESFITVNTEQSSWIGSLLAFGSVLGALPAGNIADYLGRHRSILIFNFPFLASWLLIIFSTNLWLIYAARLLGGIGCGGNCVLILMYIGEIAEPSVRGTLASTFGIFLAFGTLYAYIAGTFMSYTLFAVSGAFFVVLFLILSPFLTESPVWLIKQGRKRDVGKPLLKLRGNEYDIQSEIELLQIQSTNRASRKGGMRDLIGTKAGRRALLISVGLSFFQQGSGIDAVIFYTVTIFRMTGSSIDPFTATVIIGAVEAFMELVCGVVVDRTGRRPLLILSGTGMTICLFTFGYYFMLKESGDDVRSISWIPLSSLVLYTVFYSIGFGGVPWIMNSELFPPETKGVAGSISSVLIWTLGFVVVKSFPSLGLRLGECVIFWFFASLMTLATFFAIFIVIETKGKTLLEIQAELSGEPFTTDGPGNKGQH
ncbi:facilitated trehalose transporter Tret1-like [Athalia rosae]|uniref:facilitated trehalose transporter Tret1-like n=1 Tax=Athalia rosae TaxID=37344 RepID=UPI0020348DA6|nr:facilitated trehalose transporter Tret1-like [Athalia rosae]XP_048507018.1 facilitated trehalose transporter Tret1-like [Athalia rosae]